MFIAIESITRFVPPSSVNRFLKDAVDARYLAASSKSCSKVLRTVGTSKQGCLGLRCCSLPGCALLWGYHHHRCDRDRADDVQLTQQCCEPYLVSFLVSGARCEQLLRYGLLFDRTACYRIPRCVSVFYAALFVIGTVLSKRWFSKHQVA